MLLGCSRVLRAQAASVELGCQQQSTHVQLQSNCRAAPHLKNVNAQMMATTVTCSGPLIP